LARGRSCDPICTRVQCPTLMKLETHTNDIPRSFRVKRFPSRTILVAITLLATLIAATLVLAQSTSPPLTNDLAFPNAPGRTQGMGQDCSAAPNGDNCISMLCIDVSPLGKVCSVYCTIPDAGPVPFTIPPDFNPIRSDASPDCTISNWGCDQLQQGDGTMVGICRPRVVSTGQPAGP
jgi:hypothetical protein